MSFTLEKVVLWGRSYNEYVSMFSLLDTDLDKRILGCSDAYPKLFRKYSWIGRITEPISDMNELSEMVIEESR